MKVTKGLVSIFALPREIDDLHITLYNLKRNVEMLPRDVQMDIDLTFCMSEELTNWSDTADNLSVGSEYCHDKFQSILPLTDWSKNPKIRVETGEDILGCMSHRRNSLQYNDQYDFTIWIDCDLFFKDTTLLYLVGGYQAAKEAGNTHFIITPQFVKQWDTTWDSIVNSHFLNHKLDYELEADIFRDTLLDCGEVDLTAISTFKFAGGWCTLLSNKLLDLIGIPESFGHYGPDDTFITAACNLLKKHNHSSNPIQFVLRNHLVGETYVHRCNKHLVNTIVSLNKKEEFRAVATAHFNEELHKFVKRIFT